MKPATEPIAAPGASKEVDIDSIIDKLLELRG